MFGPLVVSALVAFGGVMSVQAHPENDSVYEYVITETSGPTSFDPLDADNSNNLPVARMIYATPLEISPQNQLTSSILESFAYDQDKATIRWRVKSEIKFQDGSAITPEDVAFAVARMAHARPKFPVIEHIDGLEKWLAKPSALKGFPDGIKIDGQQITIRLNAKTEHPLFRFCLELFSIIPKKCVNPQSGKIVCEKIPESGFYQLADGDADKILFVQRTGTFSAEPLPKAIRFLYVPAINIRTRTFGKRSVISGNEIMFSRSELKNLQSDMTFRPTPAARFAGLLLNPNLPSFREKNCRKYFAQTFRESFADLSDKTQPLEVSLFTKVLPGYKTRDELSNSSRHLSEPEIAKCKSELVHSSFKWGYVRGEKSIFVDAMELTLKKLQIKDHAPAEAPDRKTLIDWFAEGKISVFQVSSGFWALDPGGDLKMLFTRNLHKMLQFVADDDKLQAMIDKASKDASVFTQINQYLFDEALLNVYSHLRRFYATPEKSLLADIPFAITSPAPWQVFRL